VKKAVSKTLLALAFSLALPFSSKAVVLDWDTVTWSPEGAPYTHSYDIDPTNPGADVRVNISGYTGFLYTNSPRVSNQITGGLNPAENSLVINTNHATTATYVTVTIDFFYSGGVTNPYFSIFEIDTGAVSGSQFTWQDQIRNITASFGSTTYSPTFSNLGSAVAESSGTLIGTTNVDATSGDGNATLSFSGPVTRIQFDYGPGPDSISDPDGQVIALGDITFNDISGVPEVNSLWIAAAALLMAVMFQNYRLRMQEAS